MNTFDRYLLREWIQIIFLVVAALLGIILIQIVYNDLPNLLAAEASTSTILAYFSVASMSYVTVLLPLTLLVSLLYVLGQMHRNHEFTALRAAGISLARITRPIWYVGILCCVFSWYLSSAAVPWAIEHARSIKDSLTFQQQAAAKASTDRIGAVTAVTFDNRQVGRLWFMNRFSRSTGRGYGVTISFMDPQRREYRRLFATQAIPLPKGAGWTLLEGREMHFDAETSELISNAPFPTMTLPELHEDPQLMLLIDRKASDLSFIELERITNHLGQTGNPKYTSYAVRYHSLIADTLAPLIIIGLAIPFTMTGVRVNPAVGISKSIGLFALYYLFAQLGGSLATKNILTPLLAAWLPNIGMSGVALWFLARLR